MLTQPISKKFDSAGKEIFIETGRLARQADGAVTVRQGNCILLATVVANKEHYVLYFLKIMYVMFKYL